jgi:hypothetical protein
VEVIAADGAAANKAIKSRRNPEVQYNAGLVYHQQGTTGNKKTGKNKKIEKSFQETGKQNYLIT